MQNRRSCTTTMNKMSKKLVYYQSSLTHTNTFAAAATASLCHCCVAALLPGVAALVDLVSSVNELNAAVEAECECGGDRERADGRESRLGCGRAGESVCLCIVCCSCCFFEGRALTCCLCVSMLCLLVCVCVCTR